MNSATLTAPAKATPAVTPSPAEKSKAAPAATASPLAIQLQFAKDAVCRLAKEIDSQLGRHLEIERLTDQKTSVLEGVESGSMEFLAGKKALSDLTESLELLDHGLSRRGAALEAEYLECRGQLVGLKFAAIGHLKRVTLGLITARQSETRAFLMSSFGGNIAPDCWPVPAADLVASCTTLTNLENYRRTLDSWNGTAHDLLREVSLTSPRNQSNPLSVLDSSQICSH